MSQISILDLELSNNYPVTQSLEPIYQVTKKSKSVLILGTKEKAAKYQFSRHTLLRMVILFHNQLVTNITKSIRAEDLFIHNICFSQLEIIKYPHCLLSPADMFYLTFFYQLLQKHLTDHTMHLKLSIDHRFLLLQGFIILKSLAQLLQIPIVIYLN